MKKFCKKYKGFYSIFLSFLDIMYKGAIFLKELF